VVGAVFALPGTDAHEHAAKYGDQTGALLNSPNKNTTRFFPHAGNKQQNISTSQVGDKGTLGRTVLEINLDLGLAHQIIDGQKTCWISEHPVICGGSTCGAQEPYNNITSNNADRDRRRGLPGFNAGNTVTRV
jgi:hypothetical protein